MLAVRQARGGCDAHLGCFVEGHVALGGAVAVVAGVAVAVVAGVAVGIIAVILDLPPHAGCAVSGRKEGA